jgi:PAS domain S-box-containing protein
MSGTTKVAKNATTLSLKDSEIRYRRLFESTQDGILILDARTGLIEDVNPYLIKLLGYSRKEFIKKKLWDMGAFKDIEANQKSFEALQKKKYIRYENLPLKTKDGQFIQVEFISSVYLVGDKKVIQCNIRNITAHKRIVAALQENEKTYHDLINQSPDGFFVIEFSGKIIYANTAMCRELGFNLEELLSMNIWDIVPTQYLGQHRKRLSKVLRGKSSDIAAEYTVQGKDGEIHYIDVLSAPHYSGPDIIGFQGIAHDITARVRAKQELCKSEEKYRTLVDEIKDGFFVTDSAGIFTFANIALAEIYGVETPQALVGRMFSDFVTPEMSANLGEAYTSAMETGRSLDVINGQIVRPDGTRVFIEIKPTMMIEGGQVAGTQGIVRDITDNKRAQDVLHESEKRFRALIENSSDAITLLDANGRAVYDSPAAPGMLGYGPEEWIGRDVFALIHPDDLLTIRGLFQNLGKTPGARVNSTFRVRHKSGTWLWVEMVATNLLAEPSVKAIVLNYHDITERIRAEEEIGNLAKFPNENPFPVLRLNDKGIILFANKASQKLLEEWKTTTGQEVPAFWRMKANEALSTNSSQVVEVSIQGMILSFTVTPIVEAGYVNLYGRDVTEQRRSEELLHLQSTALDAAANSIIITNRDGIIEWVNPAYSTLTGYTGKEVIGKNLRKLEKSVKQDPALTKLQWETILAEKVWHGELIIRRKDGSLFTEEKTITPVINTDGNISHFISIIQDVTERKKADGALRASEVKFRSYIENTPLGVFIADQSGRYVEVNVTATKMLGYTESELLHLSIPDVLAPEALEEGLQQFQKVTQDGFASAELIFRRKDGTQFWSTVLTVRLSKDRFMAYCQDITKQVQAAGLLGSSKQVIEGIINTIPMRVFWKDKNLVFLGCNAEFARDAGFTDPKEIIGKDDFQMAWRDQAELYRSDDRQVIESGRSKLQIEEPQTTLEGDTITLLTSKVPLRDSEKKVIGVLGTYMDITERKQEQSKIQQQLEHLNAISAIDQAIAANFDLKLNLSVILKYVTIELGIDAADILVFNPDSQMLEYGADHGFRTRAIREVSMRLGESFAGRVVLERQLVRIPNLKKEPGNLVMTTLVKSEDFVCYYGLPLIVKGQINGVLELFHRAEFKPKTEWLEFLNSLAGQAAIAIENSTLYSSLQYSNLELHLAYDATIEGWSHALDLRDKETEGHTQRVTDITVNLARGFGLSEAELMRVRWGALLHDIGKMGVPDEILLKPGPLTDEEWVKMKMHPTFAFNLLSPIHYLQEALDIPYSHHEKWDGSGYPRGLKGDQIPLAARIFAVVDVWDAITSDRPYRPAWTKEKAYQHIRASSGSHFDPKVVEAFMQLPK